MPKNSKRGHLGSLNVLTNRKLQKKCKGNPLIEFESSRKKSRIMPKKRKVGPFGLASTFGNIEKICGSVQ